MKTSYKFNRSIAEWSFSKLAQATDLFEYGPTKGTIFLTPFGYHLWEQIQKYLNQSFASLKVNNVYFPSLIPLSLLEKEKQHIQGFAPELFIIDQIGNKKIKEPLALRPTSEVIFCFYFQKKIKSYRDLPLLLNQWVNVWRWEQNANPFLRNTEFLWQEGHTLHTNQEKAWTFCQKIRNEYQQFFETKLRLPVLIGQKSELEKFAGADTTWTLETLLPDGQFLQLATVHYLGQNFTKPFNIKFLNQENKWNLPYQTSWGISTRSIAAIVQSHRDHYGLVLPLLLAKQQVVILPIYRKNESQQNKMIDQYCQTINQQLTKLNLNVTQLDTKIKNFSLHCQETELKGVPVRLEIGFQEYQNQEITYVLRSDLKKQKIKLDQFINQFSTIIAQMHQDLFNRAQKRLNSQRKKVQTFEEYLSLTKNQIFEVYFCNQIECEKEIKRLTQTVSRLIWANVDQNGQKQYQKCFKCQQKTSWIAIFGRSY